MKESARFGGRAFGWDAGKFVDKSKVDAFLFVCGRVAENVVFGDLFKLFFFPSNLLEAIEIVYRG